MNESNDILEDKEMCMNKIDRNIKKKIVDHKVYQEVPSSKFIRKSLLSGRNQPPRSAFKKFESEFNNLVILRA